MFVGPSVPDFDSFFEHIGSQLSGSDIVKNKGNDIVVRLEPIFLVCDLIGKAKVLKTKQCNGYYGCTLCTQRGVHIVGTHHYPNNEVITIRSAESHNINLKALID